MKKYMIKLLVMFMFISSMVVVLPKDDMRHIVLADTVPNGSDLIVTVDDNGKYVQAYDDFNDSQIDDIVWAYTDDFYERYRQLSSWSNESLIQLNGSYDGYDSYKISVDLVDLNRQWEQWYNGGIGISSGETIWTFSENLKRPVLGRYYRRLNIIEYGSIEYTNSNGNMLRAPKRLEKTRKWNWGSDHNDIRLVLEANRVNHQYNVKSSVYVKNKSGNWPSRPLKIVNYTFDEDELDFKKIYLVGLEPSSLWSVHFDNFSFTASKSTKKDILKASWTGDVYKLSWEKVEGATKYNVYTLDGSRRQYYATVLADDAPLVFVEDQNANGEKAYVVEAVLEGGNIFSNKVQLGGDIVDPFDLSGRFLENDYEVKWTALDIDNEPPLTYTLLYGSNESTIDTPVQGAENINKNQLIYMINNIYNSEVYYGKYFKIRANVDFGDRGITDYFSNTIHAKNDISLSLSHAKKNYIFSWIHERPGMDYHLFGSALKSDLEDTNNLPNSLKSFNGGNKKREIYHKVLDTNLLYIDKYFILQGKYFGDPTGYSNILHTKPGIKTPDLLWRKDDSGKHVFSWSEMSGANKVELIYGSAANQLTHTVKTDDLLTMNKFETVEDIFDDQYVRLRFFKDDIWYYSNIIKTSFVDILESRIYEEVSEEEQADKHNLVVDWSDVLWAEDVPKRVSSYRLYYIDAANKEVEIQKNIMESHYTITDIYNPEKNLLGKNIYIESICPVKDKFDIDYNLAVKSLAVVPRKIEFNSLKGVYSSENQYTLTWSEPMELGVDVQDLHVDNYILKFGDSKSTISKKILMSQEELLAKLIDLEVYKDKPDDEGDPNYYHKFYEVNALIDNIVYTSNNQYSGDPVEMKVYRFLDDFTLIWNRIDNADEIKVYYAKPNGDAEILDEDYKLYEPAHLAGTAKEHTIEDLDDTKKEYNNHYFKVKVVFGDDSYESNAVLIDVKKSLPVLKGQYQANGSYDFSWTKVDAQVDKYQLYYDEVTTADEIQITEYKETDKIYSENDDSATVNNILSEPFYNKYVRIVAVDGHLYTFSNPEFVKETTIEGDLEGQFSEGDVNIKMVNRSDIIYNFKVLKEMKQPYIKIELNGSQYLSFDKLSVRLEKTNGGNTETLPVRLVTEIDEVNGITVLYAHLDQKNPVFSPNDNTIYRLTVTNAIVLNDRKAAEVYQALRAYDNTLENWALPYYIDDILIDNSALDKDIFIKYEAYWNINDTPSFDDERQTSLELFRIDLDVKNKNALPGSM